jgi:hypothetical protein
MKQLGEKYIAANKGSSYFLRGFEPRPQLVINPPKGVSDPRAQNFNFISAVRRLPRVTSDDELIPIFRVIGHNLRGRLKALFVILDDDQHDRLLDLVRQADSQLPNRGRGQRQPPGQPISYAGVTQGSGSGMEVEALSMLSRPPPPPPPAQMESPAANARPTEEGSKPSQKSCKSQRKVSRSSKRPSRSSSSQGRSKRSRRHRSPSSSSSSSSSSSGSGSTSDS